jgi:RNA polymerase sigma-70 factor (ECF subfamily)
MFRGSDRPHPGRGIGLIRKAGAGVYHFVWSSSKPELLAPRARPRAGRLQAIIREDGRERFGVNGVADEVLVGRVALSGDERAMSELYDRYAGLIYGAGVRYLGDQVLAEDLVQDVFTAVWRNASGFDPSRASFATWVYRITRNRATDLIRRRRARVRTVGGDTPFEPGEEDSTGELSRSFDLASALSRLSPAHREVLTLAYFDGLSQSEISRRTATPLGTVKSRTTAALRALRESMSEDERG